MRNYLFLFIYLAGFSCGQPDLNAQSKIEPDAFESMLAGKNAHQLIDVRTPDEYQDGHLANARLINFYAADFTQQLSQLDKTQPVLVYCAVGGRSGKAAAQLTKLGFSQVYDLKGGYTAWAAAGKKTVK